MNGAKSPEKITNATTNPTITECQLYAHACPDCGGLADTTTLSTKDNNNLLQSFVKAATWVHEQKKTNFTPSDLQSADVKPLISDINSVLQASTLKGIEQINHKMPHKMQKDLENNVYVFSGLKTYNELKAVSQLLLDKKGNVKSWHEFQKDILRVHKTYNINYMKAEYQFATTSAQMAAHWGQVEEDGDRYNLQYRTAGDNRVRDSHIPLNNVTLPPSDPFWKEYYPPNGWQCRCTAVQVLKNNYKQSNPKEAMAWGNESTKGPNKIFRFNPGTQKVIFPPHHPYFKDKEAVRVMEEMMEEMMEEREKKTVRVIKKKEKAKKVELWTEVHTTNGQVRVSSLQTKQEVNENVTIASYLANKYHHKIDLLGISDIMKTADSFNYTLGYEQEYKWSKKPTESAIDSAVRSASKQADHIVLYIDSEIIDGDLRNGIRSRVCRKESIKTITVIRNGNDKTYNREQIIKEDWEL